jgi:hypothetical protein
MPGNWRKLWEPQWGQLVTWQGVEPAPRAQNLEVYPFTVTLGMKAERYVVLTCLDFPPPLQRGEKIGFSSQRIRKSFTSGFEFVFPSTLPPANPILCYGLYCALCLARSSLQRVKNASIGPGVKKEKIYTAWRWEILRHRTSSKVDVL